jgi:RNA 2',3'-cyclic 3'-phosphodiesterase
VTGTGSVAPDERLRLFLALRLPEPALDALAEWQHAGLAVLGLAGLRVVSREQLHVTLAFLGHRPAGELEAIVAALREAAAAAGDLRLAPLHYRETRSVAMVVLEDGAGAAAALAADVQARLDALGVYRGDGRPWLPHVTVARFRARPGLRLEPPPMGTFVPSDAAAYLSRLHPDGARYAVLESVALGG